MSGSIEGGRKAAATNKHNFGEDFYKKIGQRGGQNGTTGGFYTMAQTNPELHRALSRKGGTISKRKKRINL